MLPPNLPMEEALVVVSKFRALDADGSGTLSLDELVRLLTEVKKKFSLIFIFDSTILTLLHFSFFFFPDHGRSHAGEQHSAPCSDAVFGCR